MFGSNKENEVDTLLKSLTCYDNNYSHYGSEHKILKEQHAVTVLINLSWYFYCRYSIIINLSVDNILDFFTLNFTQKRTNSHLCPTYILYDNERYTLLCM